MKATVQKAAILVAAATLLPMLSHAQGVAADLQSLQGVLNNLYNQMLPMCSQVIGIGQGIAGFAALWYIAVRVWKHLAAAEPIDFYPLLRPFVIGFCIMSFPAVLALINGVMSPTVTATAAMVSNSNQAVQTMLNNDQQNMNTQNQGSTNLNGDPDKWYQYSHPDNSTSTGTNASPIADQFSGWGFKNMIRKAIAELLDILFEAAALCIDTIRTFKLIVLAILGPLCFGLSVFDGFQNTLKQWLARYINVYMWLPIANIFGAIIAQIQANMIQVVQTNSGTSNAFGDTNTAYLIFMVIAIVGYFTVPGIANYIINVGNHPLFSKTTALASMAISAGANAAGQSVGGAGGSSIADSMSSTNNSSASSGGSNYMKEKLSGKPDES